jgi:hypothetical protein
MESAPDLIHLFVQALALVATSLDRWLHVPWPLPIAALFIPVLVTLDVVVWYLRGMVFPVHCGYPTEKRGLCRNPAVGEWHKCWYHRVWRIRRTDRHLVDPTLERWKNRVRKGVAVETGEIQGRGFLSMRSHRDTLLYHQGFARPPRKVIEKVPVVVRDYKNRASQRWVDVKSLGIQGLFPVTDQGKKLVATSHVLPAVIQATRTTLVLVTLGLVLVIVSIAVPVWVGVISEYCATYAFITALAIVRTGIVKADDESWLRHSLIDAVKWIAGFTGLAALGGLIGLYAHEVVDVVKAAVGIVFSGFTFLIVVYLYYLLRSKPEQQPKRRRKRAKSRKRK